MSSPQPTQEQLNLELIQAAIRGDLAQVKALIERGADANAAGSPRSASAAAAERGHTVLMWAVDHGSQAAAQFLVERGADIHRRNSSGYTALMYAVEGDYREIVLWLLDAGADLSGSNSWSENLLMMTARTGQADIVRQLIGQGRFDLEQGNRINDTALYIATERGHTPTVKVLIELGAQVNTANIGGWTPLMMASAQGNVDLIELLLGHGADVSPVNRWGATALSEAENSFRASQAIALLKRAGA